MPVPARIGRFRVTGELGRGAMGTVYRAHDDALDREVAVKVMGHGLVEAEARARFQREARAAARLHHQNIVVVYELGEHEGAPFMALELLEGIDLARAIASGLRPDPRATLPLVLQILAGLAHAHEHGIVHRDVKPSNVFLPHDRPAKIMDFGVARLAGLGSTTSGAVVGTPNYMSPEQARGGEIDGRSDLFSVGLILYELLTGDKAVQADTVVAALYKILHESPDLSVLPVGPGWDELRQVVERACARAPAERYPSATAMAEGVASALRSFGGTVDLSAATNRFLVLPRPRAHASGASSLSVATPLPSGPAVETAAAGGTVRTPTPSSPPRALWLGVAALLVTVAGAVLAGALRWRTPDPARSSSSSSLPATAAVAAATTEARTIAPAAISTTASGPAVSSTAPEQVRSLAATPRLPPPPTQPVTARRAQPPAGEDALRGPGSVPERGAEGVARGPGGGSVDERLARARGELQQARWSRALSEARAVLEAAPDNAEASRIAQEAEVELVIEDSLARARAALRAGDRETAIEEVRRGFLVRKNDPRLLAMHREALQQ
jgi:serine/threonine-protein kinase